MLLAVADSLVRCRYYLKSWNLICLSNNTGKILEKKKKEKSAETKKNFCANRTKESVKDKQRKITEQKNCAKSEEKSKI